MDTHPKRNNRIGGFGFRCKKVGLQALGSKFRSHISAALTVAKEKEQLEISVVKSVGSNDLPTPKRRRKMHRDKNQERNNEKVVWIRENEAQFIVLCHQECLEGNMLLANFTSTVYNKICDKLNALMAGRFVYTANQCRTKFKNIKAAWKLIHGLIVNRGSGLGWDSERGTITAPNDVLESIYKEQRGNKAKIKHGVPHFELCTEIFSTRTATGAHANSSRHPVCEDEDTDNVGDDDDDIDVTPTPSHTQSDIPSGSHSAYNFPPNTSSGTSQSSGRKRKAGSSERDMVAIQTMLQFGAHIEEKRARPNLEVEKYNKCFDCVMEFVDIPLPLKIKAVERLRGEKTQNMFLKMDEEMRRFWIFSLDH